MLPLQAQFVVSEQAQHPRLSSGQNVLFQFQGRSLSKHRNQSLSSPRSSSLNGFIFPRSAPNAFLSNSFRCCLTRRSTVSSKLLVFKLRCKEDSFLAVCFETLTVVDSMPPAKWVFWYIRIPTLANLLEGCEHQLEPRIDDLLSRCRETERYRGHGSESCPKPMPPYVFSKGCPKYTRMMRGVADWFVPYSFQRSTIRATTNVLIKVVPAPSIANPITAESNEATTA